MTGLGLTGKVAQRTAPGGWVSSVGREAVCRLPALAPWLRTHGAVWDNTTVHKVGGTQCREKRLLGRHRGQAKAAALAVGAGLGQGDPGNSSSTVWGQQGPSAQAR